MWVLFSAVMVTAASVYSFSKRKKKIDCTSKLSHENRSTYFKGRKKGCFIKEIGKDWLYLYTFGSDLGDNVPILFFLSLRGSFSRQLSYSLIFILFLFSGSFLLFTRNQVILSLEKKENLPWLRLCDLFRLSYFLILRFFYRSNDVVITCTFSLLTQFFTYSTQYFPDIVLSEVTVTY